MSEQAIAKRVTVVVAGTGQYNDLSINPGTSAKDILDTIGLPDYRLSKASAAPFAADANVYEVVQDGEKLYAAPHADAGR